MNKNTKDLIKAKDPREEKIKLLEKHFPGVLEKGRKPGEYNLNADKLQLILDPKKTKIAEDGYELRWVGKKWAYRDAYKPNKKLLRPLEEDSKDFATTKNILIKGDNLDALKILRQNYFGKIKMIYIDPPYNTQSDDFLFIDNFTKTHEEILEELDYDPEDYEYIKNLYGAKTHSGWLSFMYPRLLLAKDLLREDGVIFISIDDKEFAQLKLICDHIFGEDNCFGNIIRRTRSKVNLIKQGLNIQHEYCLIYAKSHSQADIKGEKKTTSNYKNPDHDPKGKWAASDPSVGNGKNRFPIENPHTGKIDLPPEGRNWGFNQEKFQELVKSKRLIFKHKHKDDERGFILKNYLSELNLDHNLVDSLFAVEWDKEQKKYMFWSQVGTKEMNEMFGENVMSFPKPTPFIKKLLQYSTSKDDIVLDFFAGSGTTGHSVMEINQEDGGKRKFIMVQCTEAISENKVEAIDFMKSINKPANIFEICAERIRRAGKLIKDKQVDTGFKVFEIVEDEKNAVYERSLAEVSQGNLKKFETNDVQDILYSFIAADGTMFDEEIHCLQEQALYLASNVAYFFEAVDLANLDKIKQEHPKVKYLVVYSPNIADDEFMLQFEDHALRIGFAEDKIKVIG